MTSMSRRNVSRLRVDIIVQGLRFAVSKPHCESPKRELRECPL